MEDAATRFNAYVRQGVGTAAWVGGCQSWYLDADGDPVLWSYFWKQWVQEMAEPDLADFHRGPLPQPVPANPLEEAA